jgi:iron(III) transport system ATP-binding protein
VTLRIAGDAAIVATGVHKTFGSTVAVDSADVEVGVGQLVALLGPSGSGKTTLLRVVAGLEVPDRGTVVINGREVCGRAVWVEPEQRRVGMVFQDGALFPHLSVEANVAFGNPTKGRVHECLDLVGLGHRARSYPHELSGGERQRIALARALAPDPDVVLLDEPFASLDAALRVSLREDVARILREAGATALLVTHDQQEALSLADVVVVMRDGGVEQTGPPQEVYGSPATQWIAEFLGAADVLPGAAGDGSVECELGRFPADRALRGAVDVVFRPESLTISAVDRANPLALGTRARVVSSSYFGHDQLVRLELASGQQVRCRSQGQSTWPIGAAVCISVDGPVSVLARPTLE